MLIETQNMPLALQTEVCMRLIMIYIFRFPRSSGMGSRFDTRGFTAYTGHTHTELGLSRAISSFYITTVE